MNEVQTDLARKLAAHERFRWLRGMVALGTNAGGYPRMEAGRPVLIEEDGAMDEWAEGLIGHMDPLTGKVTRYDAFPNLNDWPTVGALLGMLVEAWPTRRFELTHHPHWDEDEDGGPFSTWSVWDSEFNETHDGTTPGEAVARALLEVWG